ncbi:carbonate dehydratase [Chromatium weissei]|nr:carbonate dehydratase [Chromatium weissei]
MKKMILISLTLLAGTEFAFAGHDAHWGYSGAEGPEHWSEIDSHFGACQNGKMQTPIDLVNMVDQQLPPIDFHYRPAGDDEINNGHTIQVNYANGSSIAIDGHEYQLKQFHFHTPSENHIGGKEFPMEAHLVHVDAEGHIAVIAVMFQEGAENLALTVPWAEMPTHVDEEKHLAAHASAEALLPQNRDYYRFIGSLTTPPCTENVTWLVMKHPVTASVAQIHQFAQVMGHANNRPIQPLNARLIVE